LPANLCVRAVDARATLIPKLSKPTLVVVAGNGKIFIGLDEKVAPPTAAQGGVIRPAWGSHTVGAGKQNSERVNGETIFSFSFNYGSEIVTTPSLSTV
jgi:hypothetical protein